MLQIKPLIEECEEFLIESINAENFFVYDTAAEKFSLNTATESFSKYKRQCFPSICKTVGFMELDVTQVIEYLSLPDLFMNGNEMTVFRAALAWIWHNPQEREMHTLPLFKCVNLLQISLSEISSEISKVPLIMGVPECVSLIIEAMDYHGHPGTQPFYNGVVVNTRGVTDGFIAFPAWDIKDGSTIKDLAIKGYSDIFGETAPELSCWKYLSLAEKRRPSSDDQHMPGYPQPCDFVAAALPQDIDNLQMVKVNNFLFLFGIEKGHGTSCTITGRYNPLLDKWMVLRPPPVHPKSEYCFTQCDKEHILMVGGEADKNSVIPISLKQGSQFFYIYSIRNDSWEKGDGHADIKFSPVATYHDQVCYVTDGRILLTFKRDQNKFVKECTMNSTAAFCLSGVANSLCLLSG